MDTYRCLDSAFAVGGLCFMAEISRSLVAVPDQAGKQQVSACSASEPPDLCRQNSVPEPLPQEFAIFMWLLKSAKKGLELPTAPLSQEQLRRFTGYNPERRASTLEYQAPPRSASWQHISACHS